MSKRPDQEQPVRVRVAAIEQLGRVTSELLRAKTAPDVGAQRVLATLCVLATGRPSAGEASKTRDSAKKVDSGTRSDSRRKIPAVVTAGRSDGFFSTVFALTMVTATKRGT